MKGLSRLIPWLIAIACGGSGAPPSGPDGTTRGKILVTAVSTGVDLDADGYVTVLDDETPRAIGINGSILLENLLPGPHEISLEGIAANCAIQGASSRTVTATSGGTANVAFQIVCASLLATIRVSIQTSGPLPDPDGYLLALDGTSPRQVTINETVEFEEQSLTGHTLSLSGLEPNCQVSGDNPRTVTPSQAGITPVTFAVQCRSLTGSIRVTTATTGLSPDPDGYDVLLDGSDSRPLGIQGAVLLVELPASIHEVELSGLARNCSVQGGSTRQIQVALFLQSEIVFEISCASTVRAVDLGLTGGRARAINDRGEAVGGSAGRAFFWSPTGPEDLGPGDAWDLNDARVVVGTGQSRAIAWRESGAGWTRVLLPPFQEPVQSGAFNDLAASIDARGEIITGQSSPDMGRSGGQALICQVPVIWRRTRLDWSTASVELLPALDRGGSVCNGFGSGFALDINSVGTIVGVSPSLGSQRPVVWSPGVVGYEVEVLPLPPEASAGVAWAVNSAGDVVGYSERADGRVAVLWRRIGGSWSVEIVGRDEALGINDHGTIVGEVSQPSQLGWFWNADTGLESTASGAARSVNDSGQIAGEAEGRPVVWILLSP